MTKELGERLYSIGVITDTHINQGEDDCNSPFAANRLANRRMRQVIHELNNRDLAFVVNIGDLVHPVPAIPHLYTEAAARFHEGCAELKHQLYLTPGNHDVGDKPNDWAPAAGIQEDYLRLWDENFGPQYQSFNYGDQHFIIINAQIINSGFAAEEEQRQWLEADLAANTEKRIFLFSHYPPYFSKPDEEENYDNIGEPGRSWLLGLLEEFGVEALFIGHVHNFWFYRYAQTDCYLLPSTCFVRLDYSEMYRVPPTDAFQFGRNDMPKLGYFIVHMHENGHVCDIIRSNGVEAELGAPTPAIPETVEPVHPRLNRVGDFGFDMRQNWMEIIEIPPTGGLDEFDRKEVRNDYPLMALWEMGVRRIRVPMRDLLIPDNVERMRMLKAHGHDFTLFTFGDPLPHHRKLIAENQDIFTAWEIGINAEVLERVITGIGDVARSVDLPVYLSRLRSIDETRSEAGKYYHAINQGFFAADKDEMVALMACPELKDTLDGFVFRMTLDMSPWETASQANAITTELGVRASVHLRMTGANPATETADEQSLVNRMAEAMMAAAAFDRVTIYADTLADNDRGYFPRLGVLDRMFNPRAGCHLVRHMNASLNHAVGKLSPGERVKCPGGLSITLNSDAGAVLLAVPDTNSETVTVMGSGSIVDLATGELRDASPDADGRVSITPGRCGNTLMPTLILPN